MAKRWYVVHAYSGYEKQVMRHLLERIKFAEMEDEFGDILVPTEEVVEMRNGQKRKSERKFFPGYVLVQVEMNEATWHLIKDTPRVLALSVVQQINLRQSLKKKLMPFCVVLKTVVTSHVRALCLSQVKLYGSMMVRLQISTVLLKKLTMRRAVCKWLCLFLDVQPQ